MDPRQLVMNNFSVASDSKAKDPTHLESLTTTLFQSLFPPINPQATPVKSIRRVLLLNREAAGKDADSFVINFRHYAITTKSTGISKPQKRLDAAEKLLHSSKTKKGGHPNLGNLQDIAEFMIGGENGEGYMTDGGTSGSEAETDAEVEVLETVPRKALSAKARAAAFSEQQDGKPKPVEAEDNVERLAVKLVELGPRMKLRLLKVEEGLCQGKIMWHQHISKTQEESKAMEEKWEKRNKEKEERKRQQKANVERKKKEKSQNGQKGDQDDDDAEEMDLDDLDSDDYDAFDSEGLEGDAETEVNERMEKAGIWEDEEDEITRQ